MNGISTILGHISQAVAIIPFVFAMINARHVKGYLWPLFIYAILSAVVEVITFVSNQGQHRVLVVTYYVYTLCEFTLISLFYSRFFRQYFNTVIIWINIVVFLIFSLSFAFTHSLQGADHYDMAIESFVFTSYCLFLFYCVMRNLWFDNLPQSPVFWFNIGILFYFTGNLPIFIFSTYIEGHLSGGYPLLWKSIHTFFNVSMSILFSIGFWKTREK